VEVPQQDATIERKRIGTEKSRKRGKPDNGPGLLKDGEKGKRGHPE
jgi:hypothetical protein